MSKSALIIVDMVRDFTDPKRAGLLSAKQRNLTSDPESTG